MDAHALEFLDQLEHMERSRDASSPNDATVLPGERECPICKNKMTPEIYEGVAIDACEQHGVWLDVGELPRIASRIRSGGTISGRRAVERAKRDGKVSGMLFGAWSLLLD